MSIVLSNIDLEEAAIPANIRVVRIGVHNLRKYHENNEVIAIVGSRAMAIKAAKMRFPGLKLFQLTSAGFDEVPIIEYRDKGIAVANAGGFVYSAPIAETVILALLLMAKRLHRNPNNRHVKIQRRYEVTISEIVGKHILILGTGNIGTAVARRLQGFEAVVDGYNRSNRVKPEYGRILSRRQELIEHIGEYDYIISTLPASAETKGFIDSELLKRMSSNAVVVNVGRMAVFNEDDLYFFLKKHFINGAVLDMFEKLPNPITNRFRRLSNVIVMPGVSAVSGEVKERLKKHVIQNILAVASGQNISNVVNGVTASE